MGYFDVPVVQAVLAPVLPEPAWQWNPGPASYEPTRDTIGPAVVCEVGGGPGLELEGQYDRVLVALDIAGDQNDPQGARDAAQAADQVLVAIESPLTVILPGDLTRYRILSVQRAGGRPRAIQVDDRDRTHMAASYVWRVQSGV